MRVHDGMYSLAEGVRFFPADRLYETSVSRERVTITGLGLTGASAPTIDGHVLRLSFTCPCEGVFQVTVTRHQGSGGDRGFLLPGLPALPLTFSESAHVVEVRAPGIAVTIGRETWGYRFSGPRGELTSSGAGCLGCVERSDGTRAVAEMLSLRPGECVYGLGERFSPFVRNGQSVRLWNMDAGTSSDRAYKNVPFYCSSEGYGILLNTAAAVELEVATEDHSAVGITVPGDTLDYLVIAGDGPREVIERLTAVTGRPPSIPSWSLGLWLSTSFTTFYDEATVTEHVAGMTERGIPLSVFHFDCFWMRERHWCDFAWNAATFPDPRGLLARLKRRGLRICLWINPYVSELSSIFAEGAEKGYFLKRADGGLYQLDWWQPGIAFVDFTNPAACLWYRSKLASLIDMGVDTFKTDFGESAPEDAVYHDGTPGELAHNRYALLFNRTVFELLEEKLGAGNAVVFARSATMGSQRYPVHWGGDSRATYASMAAQLRAGLSFALSGGAFWSHDIGGFYGTPTPDLYKRWVAFGLLSSHARLHGNSSYRVPWSFDEESVAVLRHFARLRHSLVPYLLRWVREAHETGCPLMQPMVMAFPADPACRTLDRQYMLGGDLLVAPVFDEAGRVSWYLPAGPWYSYADGTPIVGGSWRAEISDYFSLPMAVREGAIIPTTTAEAPADACRAENLLLRVYGAGGTARFAPAPPGSEVSIEVEAGSGGAFAVRLSAPVPGIKLCFPGLPLSSRVTGEGERVAPLGGAFAMRMNGTAAVVATA